MVISIILHCFASVKFFWGNKLNLKRRVASDCCFEWSWFPECHFIFKLAGFDYQNDQNWSHFLLTDRQLFASLLDRKFPHLKQTNNKTMLGQGVGLRWNCPRLEKTKTRKKVEKVKIEGQGRQDGDMNWTGKSLVSNACHICSWMKV